MSLGAIMGLDFMDTSFKDAGEIEEDIGVPVICSIAFIEKEAETRKMRLMSLLGNALVSIYASFLLVTIFYLWKKGIVFV